MANHSDSTAHFTTARLSANWLASREGFSATGFDLHRTEERPLKCLEALGVGLEVWDDHGRRLFYNRSSVKLQADALVHVDAARLITVAQGANGAQLPLDDNGTATGCISPPAVLSETLAGAPQLQELPGNRWVQVYAARSDEGYIALARVDVTDLVRSGQYLEGRVRQLTRESSTDALTGLANRRHFDAVFSAEWNRAARSQAPISLLMVDIDYFKHFNDHYGHSAGDVCLTKVAAVLAGCVHRSGELVARYGGEEFVMLLPGVAADEACETAQKCIDRMQEAALAHAASAVGKCVSLSIGVASLQPTPALESVMLLNAADSAMYRAKARGRVRYELAKHADWCVAEGAQRTGATSL